jgi:hypothetical protein
LAEKERPGFGGVFMIWPKKCLVELRMAHDVGKVQLKYDEDENEIEIE